MTLSQAELRGRHFDLYRSILPGMIARLGWSRAEIDAFQAEQLRELLDHARRHSPWHARRLEGVGDVADRSQLARLPTMGKAELMAHWDEIVTVPGATLAGAEAHIRDTVDAQYVFGDTVLMASGGTGGRPGLFLYDFQAMAVNWASMSRTIMNHFMTQFGGLGGLRVAALGPGVSAHGSYVMGRIFSDPAMRTTAFSLWETPEKLFPGLNDVQPDFMFCASGFALQLVSGHDQGLLRIAPKVLFFGSEHLTATAQAAVQRAWPETMVFTCWGTTEAAGTFPCPLGDGFHVSEDGLILEEIDEEGQPSAAGAWSNGVLLTNLYNKAMPLIRYKIDDVFEFDEAPCACGLHYRKVKFVHGRNLERFRYGALSIHAGVMELAVLEQVGIETYQIVQTKAGVRVRYSAVRAADEGRMQARIETDLRGLGLADPEVSVERVAQVVRTGMGKLPRYVPLPVDATA